MFGFLHLFGWAVAWVLPAGPFPPVTTDELQGQWLALHDRQIIGREKIYSHSNLGPDAYPRERWTYDFTGREVVAYGHPTRNGTINLTPLWVGSEVVLRDFPHGPHKGFAVRWRGDIYMWLVTAGRQPVRTYLVLRRPHPRKLLPLTDPPLRPRPRPARE